ncbi:MAG: hypothetical protein NT154_42065 [Verrucomicrobia bacterium]|nr:hypothetical protein [Verrucomicrobiota bacterium]
MFRILGEAVVLLRRRWLLFSAVILTVWLPGNLLTDYLGYYVFEDGAIYHQMRVTTWIEGIFGPIYIGAMMYALARLKLGQEVTYKEAMLVGLKNWRRLFAARFFAGLIVILGLFALLIPGILLLVRYALLDCVVVLEECDSSKARQRSNDLTKGRRWQIFGAGALCFIGLNVLGILLYLPQSIAEPLNLMAYDVIVDCLIDIAYALIQIAMFLFYWEARAGELAAAQATANDPQFVVEPTPETVG